jgi:UTP--glucose-1-phosphate uridylyltransferase
MSEGRLHLATGFLEKPEPAETLSRLGVIGKYIITPDVFTYLEQGGQSASRDGEIRLADAFVRMIRDGGTIYGLEMEGDRYDTGDKFGFLKATIDYALDRDDLGEQMREFLIKRVSSF